MQRTPSQEWIFRVRAAASFPREMDICSRAFVRHGQSVEFIGCAWSPFSPYHHNDNGRADG